MKSIAIIAIVILSVFSACENDSSETTTNNGGNLPEVVGYPIVETNQTKYYNNTIEITAPSIGSSFSGQDAQYVGNELSYTDNGDGTITDNITGLMWQKSCDINGDGEINYSDKMSQSEAEMGAESFNLAGYDDWRLPNIKEQYSLIIFSGVDPSGYEGTSNDDLVPFIDNSFEFAYGDTDAGERLIDAQFASTSIYVSTTMGDAETMFGVNLADGRIKGYPTGPMPGQNVDKQFYVLYVRGNSEYGINNFEDNGDGTISDFATNLMWSQDDNGGGIIWSEALLFAENSEFAGFSDWRLPNAKELQSIVDYSRSPSSSASAAIDPLFNCTEITNEANELDYPCYWSSTTHSSWVANHNGANAAYVCFGRAMGYMNQWMDVHGAGSQRSDPKIGNPDDYPFGFGPQGDAIRIYNHVRLVCDIN